MRSIVDITIFKTPFESATVFRVKFDRIQTMFEDYIVNAGMDLVVENSENEHFITKRYTDAEKRLVDVSFSFQKNLDSVSYFPAGIINYSLNPFVFEKGNTEHFLNDNISFIWNVFTSEFFLDFDPSYEIDDRNKGKKLDYAKLTKFDVELPKSDANKQLLDSLMYVYFNLMKNIFDLESNWETLDNFLKNTKLSDMEATYELFVKRGDQTKNALISQAKLVKGQIDAFVQLIS